MVLDDNYTVGRKDDETIETYFTKYREVAGIELAGLENPGKAWFLRPVVRCWAL